MEGEQAFLDATLPHLDAVHRVAYHFARDRFQADDLVQETYLRAFAKFASHNTPNTRAWLIAICLNVARSEARRLRRRPSEQLGPVPDYLAPTPDVFEQVMASVDRETVASGLARLCEPQRTCLVLMDLTGLTAAETAEVLGCPRGTVLARVHRGRRKLAQLLAAETVPR